MQYSFDVQEAVDHGVDKAIIIWNLRFWIVKNKANKHNEFPGDDGILRTWTYNKIDAFAQLFPFWKPLTIWRILNSMVESGIIIKGNFNKNKHDRTVWYAFNDEERFLAASLIIAHFSKMKNASFENEKSTFQDRKMHFSEMQNADSENEKCNKDPDIKPNINPNIKTPPSPQGAGVFMEGISGWRFIDKLSEGARDLMKKNAPRWDYGYLADIYLSGIKDGKRPAPNNFDAAFPAWCLSYTKGREP